MKAEETKKVVREQYGKIALKEKGCGCGCGTDAADFAKTIGYSDEELNAIPDEANLALSCGNPTALASLKEGETVLDLGSGAGFDCFLATSKVGKSGKVIGVDMTPEMISRAKENAEKNGIENVDFRFGEIESLPVEDNSVDAVLSNCVINLSPDKEKVFKEIHRVLKPGGRAAISDIALNRELPEKLRTSIESYIGCVGGAILIKDYKKIVEDSGLSDVKVTVKDISSLLTSATKDPLGKAILENLDEGETLEGTVVSIYVEGRK